jgi:molybdopterin converting factor small subunit
MSPVIHIPTPLRGYLRGASEIEVAAETVGDALAQLVRQSPRLETYLLDPDGRLRGFVSVFVNEEDIRALDGPATRLAPRDAVVIVPTIAGGVTSRRA